MKDICEWVEERWADSYFSKCGGMFVKGTAEEREFKYCPYCGKNIKLVELKHEHNQKSNEGA